MPRFSTLYDEISFIPCYAIMYIKPFYCYNTMWSLKFHYFKSISFQIVKMKNDSN